MNRTIMGSNYYYLKVHTETVVFHFFFTYNSGKKYKTYFTFLWHVELCFMSIESSYFKIIYTLKSQIHTYFNLLNVCDVYKNVEKQCTKNYYNEFHIFDRELVLGGRSKSFVVFVKNIPHFRKSNNWFISFSSWSWTIFLLVL